MSRTIEEVEIDNAWDRFAAHALSGILSNSDLIDFCDQGACCGASDYADEMMELRNTAIQRRRSDHGADSQGQGDE